MSSITRLDRLSYERPGYSCGEARREFTEYFIGSLAALVSDTNWDQALRTAKQLTEEARDGNEPRESDRRNAPAQS